VKSLREVVIYFFAFKSREEAERVITGYNSVDVN